MIPDIQDSGFSLTVEDDVDAFLGVEVDFDNDTGAVTLWTAIRKRRLPIKIYLVQVQKIIKIIPKNGHVLH